MKTYDLNNGNILKLLKTKDFRDPYHFIYYDDFKECLFNKLMISKYIENNSLVLPNAVYMDKDDFVGYTVPKINISPINKLIEESNYDIDYISKIFEVLSYEVRNANKEEILFPDLGNISNVFMDKKTFDIKFIDYDGLQVGDFESFNISSLMDRGTELIFKDKKYINSKTCLFTTNFDKASLLTLYLYFITDENILDMPNTSFKIENKKIVLKEDFFDKYLDSINLLGSPIEEDIRKMFDLNVSNNYPITSIKKNGKIFKKIMIY